MRSFPSRLLDFSVAAAAALACGLLVLMVVAMFAAIILRQFGVLLAGTEEIATFAMVGMAFLGMPYVYRAGAHVRVETLLNRLSDRNRRRANTWSVAIGALICLAFAYLGFGLAWESYSFGDVTEGLLAVPRWIPQAPIPAGLALLALCMVGDLVAIGRGGNARFESAPSDPLLQAE